ncbi:MAG: flagellar hook-associated protein FlgK, partial [Pseudomonadota bacterium]|nr:flagellar hook-associated protein FlgK [Pseudomonadota bacterium]
MALSGLDSALSGLRVAQQQLNVISNNVSNVNTDGYTRKILPQATVAIEGETIGVRGNPIMRKVDLNLERDLWTQVSSVSALDTKATYLNRIQQFHGDPSLEISVAAELAQLKDAFSSLADSPEDNFLQRNVVDQANVFAKKVRDFASLLDQMRNDAQDQIQVAVNNVNEKLQQIADLNKQVKFNQVSGKTTAALEDQRDQAIKELSAEMEITFFTRGDGVMVVQTAQGVQLADERAETVY